MYLADGVCTIYFLTDGGGGGGGGMALDSLYPFRTLVVVFWMFTFIMCLIWLMSGYCFYIYPTPLDVSTHGHSFVNNELDNREWASFISDLYTKLRISS